jgi:cellobiose phosphorylase
LENPFEVCGNPRWCTQYNNSQTGENIGPTLSGTSTWLAITLFEMFGIEYYQDCLVINPLLAKNANRVSYTLRFFTSNYTVEILKSQGFSRVKDGQYEVTVDGKKAENNIVKLVNDGNKHKITLNFK